MRSARHRFSDGLCKTSRPAFLGVWCVLAAAAAASEHHVMPQVTNLDYDEHKGRIAIGRVHAGKIRRSSEVKVSQKQVFNCVQKIDLCPLGAVKN